MSFPRFWKYFISSIRTLIIRQNNQLGARFVSNEKLFPPLFWLVSGHLWARRDTNRLAELTTPTARARSHVPGPGFRDG